MWPPVELRELHVFLTVAEELHFGHAAERLDINPSRVSQVIRELESKLGGRLFERTSRRVRLTPFGERARRQLEPSYDALRLAVQAARQDAQTISGSVLRQDFTTPTATPTLTSATMVSPVTTTSSALAIRKQAPTSPATFI